MASRDGDVIASNWRKIQGEDKWEHLLDPLDSGLRQSLLVYGSLAQATSDAYEKDESAQNSGDCRYKKDSFFQKVYLVNGNRYTYEVTKYIYATSSLLPLVPVPIGEESNWMGYVAVSTKEGSQELGRIDVVVVWRGTVTKDELRDDAFVFLVPYLELGLGVAGGCVHQGFHSVYTTANKESRYSTASARDQVLDEVRRLVDFYKHVDNISITVTGHSLGGALATLNSIDIAANICNRPSDNPNKAIRVTAVGFATPRVGDHIFTTNYEKTENLSFIKVKNMIDPVPGLPIGLLYSDCGVELLLDARLSPYLKESAKYLQSHNLELYLHGVAGTHGIHGEFNLEGSDRPLALVNKEIDGLLDEYKIPVAWWAESKGMVQWKDGSWHLKTEVEPTTESCA